MPTHWRKQFEDLRIRTPEAMLEYLEKFSTPHWEPMLAYAPQKAYKNTQLNAIEFADLTAILLQTMGLVVTQLFIQRGSQHRIATMTSANGVYSLYSRAWGTRQIKTFKSKDDALSWLFFDFLIYAGGCDHFTQFGEIIAERDVSYYDALVGLRSKKPAIPKHTDGNTYVDLDPSAVSWFFPKLNNKSIENTIRTILAKIAVGKVSRESDYLTKPLIAFDSDMKYFGYVAHTHQSWKASDFYVEECEREERSKKIRDLLYASVHYHDVSYVQTSDRYVFDPFILDVLRGESYDRNFDEETGYTDMYFRAKPKQEDQGIKPKFFLEKTLMTRRI